MPIQKAKFSIGDIVKHKHFEFRGVIYDVDFEFNNSEEWYQSIPKNVAACPIPTHQTKLVMSHAQPTVLFNPQVPIPVDTV